MQVRGDGKVRQSQRAVDQIRPPAEVIVEYRRVTMKHLFRLFQSDRVSVAHAESFLDQVFPQEPAAALVPVCDLPELPPADVGARTGVVGPQAVLPLAGEVLLDLLRSYIATATRPSSAPDASRCRVRRV